ncbi:MAG: hypothetical protein ACPL88_12285, partial [Bryobacteraceae bacterium]
MHALWLALLLVQAPPPTRTDNVRELLHGVEVLDPYRWLEDRASPETQAWIEAQNRYSRPLLESLPERSAIERRLLELMRTDAVQTPFARAGRYFFLRKGAAQEQFVLYMREGLRGRDQALVDPHPWSADHTASIQLMDVSEDAAWLAYGVRRGGEDEVEVRFFDVQAMRDLPFSLPRARYYSVALRPARRGLYYSRYTPEGPRVYTREATGGSERETFGQGYGPGTAVTCQLSADGRHLLMHVLYGASDDRTDVASSTWPAERFTPSCATCLRRFSCSQRARVSWCTPTGVR